MESSVDTSPFRKFRFWKGYRWMKVAGRINGAWRVLFGMNASVPCGLYLLESYGRVRINDYYGGLILSLPECDLYWKADGYDGWGAGSGQGKFERFLADGDFEPAAGQ